MSSLCSAVVRKSKSNVRNYQERRKDQKYKDQKLSVGWWALVGSTFKPGQFWPHLQRHVKGSVTGVSKIMSGPKWGGCCWLFSLSSTRTRGLPTELMDTMFMLNRRWHFTQYVVDMCNSTGTFTRGTFIKGC